MKEYIVTFYSHYNAIRLKQLLAPQGIAAVLSPVPRRLSSSCGTCARFATDLDPAGLLAEAEFEQLVWVDRSEWELLIDHR